MRKLILLFPLLCFGQTTNYPGSLDTDSSLFVAADNVQSTLSTAIAAGDLTLTVASGTGFAANQIATICDVITSTGKCTTYEHMKITAVNSNTLTVTRGFAGTTARAHAAGKLVSVLIDAAHQKVLKDAVIAIETALGPNLSNVSAGAKNVSAYNYAALSCNASNVCSAGGASGAVLVNGVGATLTLVNSPLGVAGANSNQYIYISGGTGTAEATLITGGTCTSGGTNCTITFTPAQGHSGAWTIQSDSGGTYEAVNVNGAGTYYVPAGTIQVAGLNGIRLNTANVTLLCSGWGSVIKARNNALLNNLVFADTAASGFKISNCKLDGNSSNDGNNSTYGAGLAILASNVEVAGNEFTAFRHNGVLISGTVSNIDIHDNYIHENKNPANASFSYGIQSDAGLSSDIRIRSNRIVDNYPTGVITTEGGLAICLDSKRVSITDNYIANNYNYGGQIVLCGNHQSTTLEWSVVGNTFVITGDLFSTSGIEWSGFGLNVLGNKFNGGSGAGVAVQSLAGIGSAGYAAIHGNTFIGMTTGVAMLNNGAFSAYANTITGNIFQGNTTGVDVPAASLYTVISDNIFKDSVTTPISNASSSTFAQNNIGAAGVIYNQGCAAVAPGASPYTYTAGMSPEVLYIYAGTVSDVSIGGVTLATASPTQVRLNPNQSAVITYAVAPTVRKCIY